MKLVIDANILFAAALKESLTKHVLVSDEFTFFAPDFILLELKKYENELLEKTRRSEKDFNNALGVFNERIIFIPQTHFIDFLKLAKKISPDKKDVAYLALALKLGVPLWSNDKQLKEKQRKVTVYSTKDLLARIFSEKDLENNAQLRD